MPYFGKNATLCIGFQNSSYQSPTDPGSYAQIPFVSSTIKENRPLLLSQSIAKTPIDFDAARGPVEVAGTVVAELESDTIAKLAHCFFGEGSNLLNVSSNDASGYSWFYSFSNNVGLEDFAQATPKVPFSVLITLNSDVDSGADLYTMMQMAAFEVRYNAGQYNTLAFDVAGGYSRTNVANTFVNSAVAAYPFTGKTYRQPWHTCELFINSQELFSVEDFTLRFEDAIELRYGLSDSPLTESGISPIEAVRTGGRTITFNGTARMNQATFLGTMNPYKSSIGSVDTPLTFRLGKARDGSANNYGEFLVSIANAKLEDVSAEPSGPGEIPVQFSGRAVKPNSSNSYAIVVLATSDDMFDADVSAPVSLPGYVSNITSSA